jgi:hypothetical protein
MPTRQGHHDILVAVRRQTDQTFGTGGIVIIGIMGAMGMRRMRGVLCILMQQVVRISFQGDCGQLLKNGLGHSSLKVFVLGHVRILIVLILIPATDSFTATTTSHQGLFAPHVVVVNNKDTDICCGTFEQNWKGCGETLLLCFGVPTDENRTGTRQGIRRHYGYYALTQVSRVYKEFEDAFDGQKNKAFLLNLDGVTM